MPRAASSYSWHNPGPSNARVAPPRLPPLHLHPSLPPITAAIASTAVATAAAPAATAAAVATAARPPSPTRLRHHHSRGAATPSSPPRRPPVGPRPPGLAGSRSRRSRRAVHTRTATPPPSIELPTATRLAAAAGMATTARRVGWTRRGRQAPRQDPDGARPPGGQPHRPSSHRRSDAKGRRERAGAGPHLGVGVRAARGSRG
jgi:hypothetical protein